MSKSIPFANRTIGEILAEIHAASRPEKIGVEFERLFLYAAPRIPDLEVKNIWTWADWPQREKRASFLDGADFGVDLVAELRDGKLVAGAMQVLRRRTQGVKARCGGFHRRRGEKAF